MVAEIHLDERKVALSCDFLDTLEAGEVAIGKVVGYYYVVSGLDQLDGYVASYVACTA